MRAEEQRRSREVSEPDGGKTQLEAGQPGVGGGDMAGSASQLAGGAGEKDGEV